MDDYNGDIPENNEEDEKNEKRNFEVGYGKPPKHTQFKKGQSGNKKGRPKGSKNKPTDVPSNLFNELILKEGMREIFIQEGNKRKKVTMIEATLKSLAMKAVKGDHRSHKLMLELFGHAENNNTEMKREMFETSVWFKEGALKEIEQAKEQGLPEPDILPHPNHIKINPRTGEAKIEGPMNEKEKEFWDMWVARKVFWTDEINTLKECVEKKIDPVDSSALCEIGVEALEHDIKHLEDLVEIARKLIPDDYYITPSTREFLKTKPDIWKFEDLKEGN